MIEQRHSWVWNKPDDRSRQCQKCGLVASIFHHKLVGGCSPKTVKPKPDESRLLTDEDMARLSHIFPEGFTGRVGFLIAKAQLAKDLKFEQQAIADARKQERERLLKEIEGYLGIPQSSKPFVMTVSIGSEWWQALGEEK